MYFWISFPVNNLLVDINKYWCDLLGAHCGEKLDQCDPVNRHHAIMFTFPTPVILVMDYDEKVKNLVFPFTRNTCPQAFINRLNNSAKMPFPCAVLMGLIDHSANSQVIGDHLFFLVASASIFKTHLSYCKAYFCIYFSHTNFAVKRSNTNDFFYHRYQYTIPLRPFSSFFFWPKIEIV